MNGSRGLAKLMIYTQYAHPYTYRTPFLTMCIMDSCVLYEHSLDPMNSGCIPYDASEIKH